MLLIKTRRIDQVLASKLLWRQPNASRRCLPCHREALRQSPRKQKAQPGCPHAPGGFHQATISAHIYHDENTDSICSH
jgi:hypothetical protein